MRGFDERVEGFVGGENTEKEIRGERFDRMKLVFEGDALGTLEGLAENNIDVNFYDILPTNCKY